jgi:hypothetical protein
MRTGLTANAGFCFQGAEVVDGGGPIRGAVDGGDESLSGVSG